jgi:hypothetical protein
MKVQPLYNTGKQYPWYRNIQNIKLALLRPIKTNDDGKIVSYDHKICIFQ